LERGAQGLSAVTGLLVKKYTAVTKDAILNSNWITGHKFFAIALSIRRPAFTGLIRASAGNMSAAPATYAVAKNTTKKLFR
jgi:hypothetical protein